MVPTEASRVPSGSSGGSPDVPRVVPWVVLGTAAGLVAAAVALAAWVRADDPAISAAGVAAVSVITVLFGAVVGLAVGQFIRMAGIVRAWRPPVPTVLDAPVPSSNGHGSSSGDGSRRRRGGAVFAMLSAVGAVLAGPVVVALQPAPIVLAVGALALDERAWVRIVASSALFVAGLSLVGYLVDHTLSGGARGPVFVVAIVLLGVAGFFTVRRVHPAA